MIARMSGPQSEGTFLETGVDGVRRLYSYKRMYLLDNTQATFDDPARTTEDLALSKARKAVYRNVALLLLAALLAGIGAWLVGDFTIMRRVNRLMTAAKRLGADDLTTRTGFERKDGELGLLGARSIIWPQA